MGGTFGGAWVLSGLRISPTGGRGVGGDVGVWGLRVVGGAVKEGKGGYVGVDGKDLGEEVGGVDEAG